MLGFRDSTLQPKPWELVSESMDSDPGEIELSGYAEADEGHPDQDEHVELLSHIGKRLISSLLGLNLVVFGVSCVVAQALNQVDLTQQQPRLLVLVLVGFSLLWMLWFLLWARKHPSVSPQRDHHAAGTSVICVLLLFAACSVLLYICRMVYVMETRQCKAAVLLLAPFIETPFLIIQTYLLWAHSKDCIHSHKTIIRTGLVVIFSSDLLLWLSAVMEDSIHVEIELEKEDDIRISSINMSEDKSSVCQCAASASCLVFRKGFELLFPFHMEFYLTAACLVYVMWTNVGRRMDAAHHPSSEHKLNLHLLSKGRLVLGLVCGVLVLLAGVAVFILYQVWVGEPDRRHTAFIIFYSFHLCVTPLMCLSSLAGMVLQRLEKRKLEGGHNPTRSLDVTLLLGTVAGPLALAYLSLLAAMFVSSSRSLRNMEVSYSALSLMELVLQNIFIISGLHRHQSALPKRTGTQWRAIFKKKKKKADSNEQKTAESLLEVNSSSPPGVQVDEVPKSWSKRITQEICVFLIFSNITMWFIPAFGVHPQFENGLGKQFFGFTAWFVLANMFQPLSVFYRMHSVGALMELLVSA